MFSVTVKVLEQQDHVIYFFIMTSLAVSRRIGGGKEGLQKHLLEQYFSNCRSRYISGMCNQLGILPVYLKQKFVVNPHMRICCPLIFRESGGEGGRERKRQRNRNIGVKETY